MRLMLSLILALAAPAAVAGPFAVEAVPVPEWKAVYGRIEPRDRVPARARIGGTVSELLVTEGDAVAAGQKIATVRDDKLAFQVAAVEAQLAALKAELSRAEAELARGQSLARQGIATPQRLDQLRTDAEVVRSRIAAAEAQKSLVLQQQLEGEVFAPLAGRVLTTPGTRGGVVMAGEPVATIGGGGFFLRLAVAERHARALEEGAPIRIVTDAGEISGRLAKLYPQIENGRVIADVEATALDAHFVDARVLVHLPVGERRAVLVPEAALAHRHGVDFVRVGEGDRAVVPGERILRDGAAFVEILSGLAAGETVEVP